MLFSLTGLLLAAAVAAQVPAPGSDPSQPTRDPGVAPPSARVARQPGKPVLPDPALLDGAPFPAEKRAERGMLGEFEIEGKEPTNTTDKVGGSSAQQGGQQSANMPAMPTAGGGGQTAQNSQDNQQQNAGGAQEQNAQNGQGGGKPLDQNDPNAKAEGIAVANLETSEGALAQDAGAPAKPNNMQIGDAAMQISTLPPAAMPDVVGVPQATTGTPQQFEKPVAGGGRQSSGNRSGGAEKGRNMPPGI